MSEPNSSHYYVDGSHPCLEAPWLHLIGLFNVAASISSRVLEISDLRCVSQILVLHRDMDDKNDIVLVVRVPYRPGLPKIQEYLLVVSSEVATMQYVRPHTSTLFLLSFILALKWAVAVLSQQGGWSGSEQHLGRHGGLKTGDSFTASCRHSPRARFSTV